MAENGKAKYYALMEEMKTDILPEESVRVRSFLLKTSSVSATG